MFSIAWPWLLAGLPIPLAVYFLVPEARSSEPALRIPFFKAISGIASDSSRSASARLPKLIMLALIWVLLTIAASRPQWLGEITDIPVSGRDLMLAVDVSGSMKSEDMIENGKRENRLTAVKRVAETFIKTRVGDRIGLILFGTRAYMQAPLSFDRAAVNTLLQESAIGIAGEKTAIGDAIGLALKRLRDHYREGGDSVAQNEKVLILLTDGANTAGGIDPLKAAELAGLAKLKIYTIGVGADTMVLDTVFGQKVVQSSENLDENTLTAIAEMTGGRYFRATDVESLNEIYGLIDKLEPLKEESKDVRPTTELFYFPLGLALILTMWFLVTGGGLLGAVNPSQTHDDFKQAQMP